MNIAPIKPTINFSDLEKIDIRVATILKVENIDKSDKLVKLTIDLGNETRTVVVGMKQERENPKEIEGRQALFVVNLPQKQIMGVTSNGMLFDIGYADGITPVLAITEKNIPNGARAG